MLDGDGLRNALTARRRGVFVLPAHDSWATA